MFFAPTMLFVSVSANAHIALKSETHPVTTESTISLPSDADSIDSLAQSIYDDLQVSNLNYHVFHEAFSGYLNFRKNGDIEKTNVITIIDFDKSSDKKRFYVVDIDQRKLLHNSYVAHGQKTGGLEAKYFSNNLNSHQSSLGFYLTDKTYTGKHGLSLRLDGLDKGLNDNARKRNIVVHSANYVSQAFIERNSRLGRSWGCPALPKENYEEVIKNIKNKSLLFIYSSKNKQRHI
jgi:hypothetical protein